MHTAVAYDCIYNTLSSKQRATIEKNLFVPMADFIMDGMGDNHANNKTFNKMHNHATWATAAVGMIGFAMNREDYVKKALYGSDGTGKRGGFIRQMDYLFQLWYGDILYADSNGDMNYGDTNDRDFSGHTSVPKFNLGFNCAFSYKNIDFSMLWSGAFGHYLNWNTDYYNSTLVSHGYGIIEHIADNHYFFDPSNPDDPRTNQWGKYPRLTYGTTYNNRIQSDWNEYKGDYFKLKNIQIGYTLPQRISSKFFVNKLRAFVSMDNILTITSYPGLDPEIGTAIGYPLMRQISFGGQITF